VWGECDSFRDIAEGCRLPNAKITIEFDQTVDFSKYKDLRHPEWPVGLNCELTKKQVDADIVLGLTAKCLTMVPSGPSDLNVRCALGTARRAEIENYPVGWYGTVLAWCEYRDLSKRSLA
jgi:hypothetical protein